MAVQDTRAVVNDPLALNVGQTAPERSLQTTMIRNPGQQGDQTRFQQAQGLLGAVAKFNQAVTTVLDQKKEDWQTEGKLKYMQGATEDVIDQQGNLYMKQGWEAMNTVDKANTFMLQESARIKENGYETDPETYRKEMMERRAEFMKNLPADPAIRKLYVAAFDDIGPRLVSTHFAAHNEYNKAQRSVNFQNMVRSGGKANSDASVRTPGVPLALSPGQVRTTFAATAEDRDTLIRTMMGEANGESDEGLAAVAHVVLNRVQDGGYMGSTIGAVAKAPKQFSAWNKGVGGNDLVNRPTSDPGYIRAAKIADLVLSGRHADPTNGATHYFSPAGMQDMKNKGQQNHLVPSWWEGQVKLSNGSITIGGHKFAGKARNQPQNMAQSDNPQNQSSETVAAETYKDVHPEVVKKYSNTSDEDLLNISKDKNMPPELQQEAASVLARRTNRRGTGTVESRPLPPLANVEQTAAQGDQNADKRSTANTTVVEAKPGDNPVATAAAMGQTTRETPSGPVPQLQAQVRAAPGKPKEKANDLADVIIQDLASDDDQVFRDSGGVGFLQELGADPARIRQVLLAKKQYDQRNLNKFSAAERKWELDLYDRISNGMSESDALAELEKRARGGEISDQRAQAIANKVITEGKKLDKDYNMSFEAQSAMTNVYQQLQKKEMTIQQADEATNRIARQYNMPKAQLKGFVDALWRQQQQEFDAQRAEVKKLAEEKRKQDQTLAQIGSTIDMGYGLDGVTGKVKTKNAQTGHTEEISAQQAGVRQILNKEAAAANAEAETAIRNGIPEDQARTVAQAGAESRAYAQLNRQNVVNEGMASTISAALSGSPIGTNGKVTDAAEKSLDWFLRMKNDPKVGGAYADRYFKNEQSRDLAHTAVELYSGGGMDLKEAVAKAYEVMQNKDKMPERTLVQNSPSFDEQFKKTWADKEGEILGTTSVLGIKITSEWRQPGWSGPPPVNQFSQDLAKQTIGRLASVYQLQNPAASDKTNIEKATNDFINGAFRVGNNLIHGKDAGRLDRRMGLEGYGKGAPHYAITLAIADEADKAVKAYRENAGKGDDLGWGRYFYRNKLVRGLEVLDDVTIGRDKRELPEYTTAYNASTGQLYVYLPEKEGVPTKPMIINVDKAGRDWRDYKKYGKAQDSDSIFTTIGRGINRLAVAGSKAPDRPADLLNAEVDSRPASSGRSRWDDAVDEHARRKPTGLHTDTGDR